MIRPDSLEAAIAATISYFDVFACAPRAGEIHRFLVGRRATRAEVEDALGASRALGAVVAGRGGFYHLRGKAHLVPRRIRFLELGRKAWARARAQADTLERTGLATAAMVTGSLAADNADEHADVDFLLVYPAARAWTSWAGVRLIAKLPGMGLGNACPNYCLPDDRLEIRPQNLFTAWEIAKAVPMFGLDVYQQFVLANVWVARLLPNALPLLDAAPPLPPRREDPAALRALTGSAPFRWLEAREQARKFAREKRDVGVDMKARIEKGSVDRHAPTRSFQALCELRYRLDLLGLAAMPIYRELLEWTGDLDAEMTRFGEEELERPRLAAGA